MHTAKIALAALILLAAAPAPKLPESKPAEKDNLQLVVRMDKNVYALNEPITFHVIYTNTDKQNTLALWDYEYRGDWKIRIGDWEAGGLLVAGERKRDESLLKRLKPGESVEVAEKMGHGEAPFLWRGPGEKKPVDHLPVGTYNMKITLPLNPAPDTYRGNAKPWEGKIETNEVTFEIVTNKNT